MILKSHLAKEREYLPFCLDDPFGELIESFHTNSTNYLHTFFRNSDGILKINLILSKENSFIWFYFDLITY